MPPSTPDSSGALIKSRTAFHVILVLEALFIGYLATQAFVADRHRLLYALGAAGLALVVGAVAWARLRPPR
ncbi:hypothetical protein [Micromonospora siamensis]|uniref:Uncharacterized protein n=1 Tax=Micromonospora siamensis TaxID=299152 RepID=A0A1C5IRR4_9ACTN|nr:hypothetical protein [Micromonospora siamensis]SCG61058.1 hypothetical protein GA0074704_3738 [Micromonospora siamensis]